MERPTTLPNLWAIVKTFGFLLTLEGVIEWYADNHQINLFRQSILLLLGGVRDPARPHPPDDWSEWYNM